MSLIHAFDDYLDDDASVMVSKCGENNKDDTKIRTIDDFRYYKLNGVPPGHKLCEDCSTDVGEPEIEEFNDFRAFRKKLSRQELREGEEPTTIHITNKEKSNDKKLVSLCGYKLLSKLSDVFESIGIEALKENEDACKRCQQLYEK